MIPTSGVSYSVAREPPGFGKLLLNDLSCAKEKVVVALDMPGCGMPVVQGMPVPRVPRVPVPAMEGSKHSLRVPRYPATRKNKLPRKH